MLQVVFARGEGFLALPPGRLPPHQGAFALTVHRAQGSEFDAVMLVLPQFPARVLGRELLYTGLACARTHATLVGSGAVVETAIRWPAQRCTGLAARLGEALRLLAP
jgi:exodeoxyribonuclease V alpha subunit